jgi:ATP-binding cassette subfamily B protein
VIQLFGIYDPGLILIGQVTSAFILLYGGLRVMEGTLGVGVMMAAMLYARRFYDPMEQLAMFYNSFQTANSGLEKISGVFQEEPSVADPANPVEVTDSMGHIEFECVRFSFGDGK